MNYININYETEEERNLRKMRSPKANKQCNHSYIIHRMVKPPLHYYMPLLDEWIFNNKIRIHLRCEKCGATKKVNVHSDKISAYKIGDRWKAKT